MPDKPAKAHPSNPWPLLGVLAVLLVGVVVIITGHWRLGSLTIAAATGLAALLRLILPRQLAGLLVVRRRPIDVLMLTGFATAIAILAMVVPPGK